MRIHDPTFIILSLGETYSTFETLRSFGENVFLHVPIAVLCNPCKVRRARFVWQWRQRKLQTSTEVDAESGRQNFQRRPSLACSRNSHHTDWRRLHILLNSGTCRFVAVVLFSKTEREKIWSLIIRIQRGNVGMQPSRCEQFALLTLMLLDGTNNFDGDGNFTRLLPMILHC